MKPKGDTLLIAVLNRMAELRPLVMEWTEKQAAEWTTLQKTVQRVTIPILDAMCKAGMLAVHVEGYDKDNFAVLDCHYAYPNGAVVVKTDAFSVDQSGTDMPVVIDWPDDE